MKRERRAAAVAGTPLFGCPIAANETGLGIDMSVTKRLP
jgi:hypothetical protein